MTDAINSSYKRPTGSSKTIMMIDFTGGTINSDPQGQIQVNLGPGVDGINNHVYNNYCWPHDFLKFET